MRMILNVSHSLAPWRKEANPANMDAVGVLQRKAQKLHSWFYISGDNLCSEYDDRVSTCAVIVSH